jgi:UDP-N-acetylglucosamine acyltransferase
MAGPDGSGMATKIHPSSIVDSGAELGDGVEIGPFCTVGPKVRLAEGVRLVSHVSVAGNTWVGPRTLVYPFAALGHPPQDLKYKGEDTLLRIGADNVMRESTSFHCGTPTGRGQTIIGDNNYFMATSHIAHDGIVGNNVIVGNSVAVGGIVHLDDFVIMGGNCAVHQFVRVGKYGFIGGGAALVADVIPFGMVDSSGRLHGLNLVGMKRRGFKRETIHEIRGVYDELFHGAGQFDDRLDAIAKAHAGSPEVMMIVDFINAGQKRPLCLPRQG